MHCSMNFLLFIHISAAWKKTYGTHVAFSLGSFFQNCPLIFALLDVSDFL